MRLAVLADAHANLPALEAALGAVRSLGCDAVYHLGDLISIGPYPAECLRLALATPGLRLTLGNHETVYARGIPRPRPEWLSDGEEAHERWLAEQDVQTDGAYELHEHRVPYDDTELLREYERREVPEREFIIRHLLWRS
jgi:predicted phosphodiesterase